VNGNPVTGHLADQQLADRRTIAALVASDPNALETLYNEYATLVITVINRMVRDRRIAEELLQEVFCPHLAACRNVRTRARTGAELDPGRCPQPGPERTSPPAAETRNR